MLFLQPEFCFTVLRRLECIVVVGRDLTEEFASSLRRQSEASDAPSAEQNRARSLVQRIRGILTRRLVLRRSLRMRIIRNFRGFVIRSNRPLKQRRPSDLTSRLTSSDRDMSVAKRWGGTFGGTRTRDEETSGASSAFPLAAFEVDRWRILGCGVNVRSVRPFVRHAFRLAVLRGRIAR